MRRHLMLAALAAATTLLGGCWDDDDMVADPVAMPNEVPDSALVSATAYTSYVGSLAASETAAPVDVGKITTAPSSETAAPSAI